MIKKGLAIIIVCISILCIKSDIYAADKNETQMKKENVVYFATDNAVSIVEKSGIPLSVSSAEFSSSSKTSSIEFNDKLIAGIKDALSKADEAFFSINKKLKDSKIQEVEMYIDVSVKSETEIKIFVLGGNLTSGIKVKMVSKP